MQQNNVAVSLISVSALFAGVASGGMSNLYITNTDGNIYEVDGGSLQSSQVSLLNAGSNLNEILYDGNHTLLYNDAGRIMSHDLLTAQETLVISTSTGFDGGATISAGLAHAQGGDLFYTANHIAPGESDVYAITADRNTQQAFPVVMPERPTFFDHHMVSENLFIGATFSHDEIVYTNALTGQIEDRFDVVINIVSFFENEAGLFGLTINGELHSIDLDARSTSFFGQINGFSGNLIGATIPAPSAPLLLMIASGIATRRIRG